MFETMFKLIATCCIFVMMGNNSNSQSGNVFDYRVLKRIFKFVKPYKTQFYIIISLTVLLGFLAPILPVLVNLTIDNYITKSDHNGLTQMLILMTSILVLKGVIQYFQTYLSGWLGQSVIRDIRIDLYKHITKLKLQFFDKTPIGRLVTRNVSDIETLADVFTQGLAAIIGDLFQVVAILIVMLMVDWRLALVGLCTLPFLVYGTYIFKEKIKTVFNDVRNAVSKLNSFVQEHITGMSIVQIFNSEDEEYEKFIKINEEHTKANIRSVMYYSIYFPFVELVSAISIAMIVWYGAGNVLEHVPRSGIFMGLSESLFGAFGTKLDSTITVGTIAAFVMYVNMFFRPIRMIADRFNTLQMGVVSSKRLLDLLDSEEHIVDEGNYEPKELIGDVEFQNVWFAYNEEDYVLKDISFKVGKGETLAFVGATGAGKSSIVNLINRFYEINKGSILIDNKNAKEFQLAVLRKNIGVVLQDVFLFSGSIEYNINLGDNSITKEQIWNAAKLVGADKFINKLPGELDYEVKERGATLSVGQRQLISFVRAMVYNPKILILDEATSSVDTETEEMIQYAISKMMEGRTSIVIAHRLSTIQKADNIIVLDKGEIKEQGTHANLLNLDGHYAQLHKMQFAQL